MKTRVAVALAPAKVNLGLDVLGRRADGYHEIDTHLVAIALCDFVHVARRVEPGVAIRVRGPAATSDVTADRDNLALRAAELALDESGSRGGLDVELVKHVPSRSGLGGASSDAAAALLAAQAVLDASWPSSRTLAMLSSLGSDTVFFGAARFTGHGHARGRGERVEVLPPMPATDLVLVVPDVGCPTPDVYREHARSGLGRRSSTAQPNVLELAALAAVPSLAPWRAALPPEFVLSGSGSAFFARVASAEAAHQLLADTQRRCAALGLQPRLLVASRTRQHGARLLAAR